jgi:ribosomal protein L12E/L44/L45/RPP1/RPP2
MLLNSAGAEIDAKSVTKVLKAAGLKTDVEPRRR